MGTNCSYFAQNPAEIPDSIDHIEALGDFGLGFAIYGGVSTSILGIFFVLSMINVVSKSPPTWRRLLTWIISFPFIVSLLSLITFLVPGAALLCDTVKQSYLPFLLMHFIDLSLLMEGGHIGSVYDWKTKKVPIKFCSPPWCCTGLIFKDIYYDKKKLRFMKGLVYQTPLIQLVINMLVSVLEAAGVLTRQIKDDAFLGLELVNILLFTIGMYGYNVLTAGFAELSQWRNYALKARVLFLCVVLLKVQTLILVIINVGGSIPCVTPYISPVVMRKTIDASLCLLETLLFGIIFYPIFRVVDNKANRLNPQPTTPSTPSQISVVSGTNSNL